MQQDNNIENILRRLDEQQQPDLGGMDAHWNRMQVMLQPVAAPVQKGLSKTMIGGISSAVILAVAVLLYLYLKKDDGSGEPPAKQNMAAVAEAPKENIVIPVAKDSVAPEKNIVAAIPHAYLITDNLLKDTNYNEWKEEDSAFAQMKINFAPCGGCPEKKTDSSKEYINRQAILDNLFQNLAKEAQTFTINNSRDTFLFGREGTSVFIPAYAFNGKDSVQITVSEYYSYPDMILNGLITKSGNDQLISGGMIKIEASINQQIIPLNETGSLRVFLPGINTADSFQVFEGRQHESKRENTLRSIASNAVDWQLSNVSIDSPVSKMFIRAIDLRDMSENMKEPFSFRQGWNKGIFIRSRASALSNAQLKEILKEKYGGYYDKIVVRKQWERNLFFKKTDDEFESEWGGYVWNSLGVGDTAELTPLSIRIYKLQPIDTVYKVLYWINRGMRQIQIPVVSEETKARIGEKYSIQINRLGWINCDRFYKVPGPKTSYAVDLKDSSFSYYTVMVFDKFKSVLSGMPTGPTTVRFDNIPANVPFKIISIGVDRQGNIVSAIKEGPFNSTMIDDLRFEPTSASALKTSLSKMNQ